LGWMGVYIPCHLSVISTDDGDRSVYSPNYKYGKTHIITGRWKRR
jgi:hypothetical protein